jgi:hypothetical protein
MEGVFESRVSERYSGRPNTLHLDDFSNRLEAAYHKAKLKEKRLQRAEFCVCCQRTWSMKRCCCGARSSMRL